MKTKVCDNRGMWRFRFLCSLAFCSVLFFGGCRQEAVLEPGSKATVISSSGYRDFQVLSLGSNSYNYDLLLRKNNFSCSNHEDAQLGKAWHLQALNIPNFSENNNSVRIGISDSGLDMSHPDLKENIISGVDFRVAENGEFGTDPTPNEERAKKKGDHGTNVAGIIGAESCNSEGSRGVAPYSKVGGINLIAPEVVSHKNFRAFLLTEPDSDFKLFNQSWGYDKNLRFWASEFHDYISAVKTAVESQKLFIKAAGNEYPRDAAYDPDQRHPFSILVAALNEYGTAASYSAPGANLWIAAPSAESKPTAGIFTTEATAACASPKCYQPNFSGTSAAAPMVTGVVALMLEKNTALTWRDIKYILAKTATKVGASGWTKNQAGFDFNRDYGFGLVDASEAVLWAQSSNLASKSWGDFKEQHLGSQSPSLSIPDNQEEGITSSINATQNLTIEALELTLNITHQFPSDLLITLTSPSGTEAIVLEPHPDFFTRYPHMRNIRFMVNHFYGETTNGTNGNWTLKISDRWQEDAGTLESWSLKAYGH